MTNQGRVLELKVTLSQVEPPVWRRVQVPESYTFWDLHVAIQDAMGWQDCHLHMFRVVNPKTGQPELIGIPDEDAFEDDPVTLPGWDLPIAPYFKKAGASAAYEYDFGDDWQHEIVVEDIIPRAPRAKYPRCVAGARCCPPEDCGGVGGYEELLEVLRDPAHEEHASIVEWLGGNYEPDAFDAKKVRFDDPRKRWRVAFRAE
jgi:Plasmid pRiA4b ORF-3-like protein